MKMRLKICAIVLFSMCFTAMVESSNTQEKKCTFEPSLEEQLQSKSSSQKKALESLEAILAKDTVASVPLTALFSIELTNEKAIQIRIKELSTLDERKLLKTQPYLKWADCGGEKNFKLDAILKQQLKINELKVKILSLKQGERNSLLSVYGTRLNQSAESDSLKSEQNEAEKKKQEATLRLEKAENVATESQGNVLKEIAGQRSLLEKFTIDFENDNLKFVNFKIAQSESSGKLADELALLESISASDSNKEHTAQSLERAAEIWRGLVDQIFKLYWGSTIVAETEIGPPYILDPSLSLSPAEKQSSSEYLDAYEKIKLRQQAILETQAKYLQRENELVSSLLLKAGAVRSLLFNQCRKNNCKNVFEINEPLLLDVVREVKVVPFKVFALGISKAAEAKRKASGGLRGWIDLSAQVAFLLIIFLMPFGFLYFLKFVSRQFDVFRRNLVNRSMVNYKFRTSVALWISRINPFVPWIGMLLFSSLAQEILLKTDVSELADLILYLKLYFWYKISVLILSNVLGAVFKQSNLDTVKLSKEKIHKTSLLIARLYFIETALIHATSSAVREAYVYTFLTHSLFYLNVFMVFVIAKKWRSEIYLAALEFSPKPFLSAIKKSESSSLSFVIAPVLFLVTLVVVLVLNFVKWLATLDFVKWVGSEIFRKRLEKSSTGDVRQEPPPEYLALFDFRASSEDGLFIRTDFSPELKIQESIEEWIYGRGEEDAIVLHGNRGLGKTTLLQHLNKNLAAYSVFQFNVRTKTIHANELYEILSKGLKYEIKNANDFLTFDAAQANKLIISIDDVQNLFLSQLDGLEAYRALQDLVNLQTKNIFWILTLNSRSWNYLKGVFGAEHFYGRVFEMRSWSDVEIQKLILLRHAKSSFSKNFDDSIKAFGSGESGDLASQTEVQFFRLLWGQSRGNPRSALVYWLTAIDFDNSARSIRIGVPQFLNSTIVTGLSDDAHFVLAAITRHENLSGEEVASVTGIPALITRKCLKQAEGRELIWKDSQQRFRVSPRAQYFVDFYLLGKNFIHE